MKKTSTVRVNKNTILKGHKLTIGVDLGDRWSCYCVLDEAGEIILEQKVAMTPEAMKQTFSKIPQGLIALETGTHSPWVSRLAGFVEEWRTTVAVNLKGSTTRAAESHLRAHIIPKLGNYHLPEITTKIVQGFVAYLASGGRSRKTAENILLTLSSLLKTARSWGYACGDFRFADLTLPREGVKVEPRSFTDDEVRKIISSASEPLSTIVAVTAVLGLRIGETLALRTFDVDFARHLIRVRQSVDAATRTVCGVKSNASSADLPMSRELETRLRTHLQRHSHKNELLFANGRGRPFSANKLREKQLHPLLDELGIPRGGFHSMRHGAASSLLADGVTPAVVQKQLRHSDARITLGIYGHVVGDAQRNAVQNRSTKLVN
jgi:integrase